MNRYGMSMVLLASLPGALVPGCAAGDRVGQSTATHQKAPADAVIQVAGVT